jgi:putative transposase
MLHHPDKEDGGITMEKRYNFRIYPTAAQEVLIEKAFGCCRFVYNYYLAKRTEAYREEHRLLGLNECSADLTRLKREEGFEWLAEADANALLVALKDLDRAYRAFFRRVKRGGAPGFPTFRNKRAGRSSYTSRKNVKRENIKILERENRIKLPKLGLVRCRVSRPAEGRILSATVFRTPAGKYFVSVCCTDVTPRPLRRTDKSAGLHLGLTDLVTTSDGERVKNPRYFAKAEKKIARLSRRLSRKSKDGKNREKARIKLARAHERIANQRSDFLNKLSTRLVRAYDRVCVKDVKPAGIMKDRRFAKLVADAGWGGLLQRLRYKCDWYGKEFIPAGAFFPSARTCGACGFESAEVGRKNALRVWDCPVCGARHERGVNAAENVLREGLRTLAAAGADPAEAGEKPRTAPAEEGRATAGMVS